jgi:hypothetical protein
MKRTVLIFATMLLFFSAAPTFAKEWRGLAPMKSVREDVRRLLGEPAVEAAAYEIYELAEETVWVEYVTYRCDVELPLGCPTAPVCKLPPHTVLAVMVRLHRPVPVSELDIDLSKLEKNPDDHNSGRLFFYKDREQGFSVHVLDGAVVAYGYHPTKEDKKLFECPRKK